MVVVMVAMLSLTLPCPDWVPSALQSMAAVLGPTGVIRA